MSDLPILRRGRPTRSVRKSVVGLLLGGLAAPVLLSGALAGAALDASRNPAAVSDSVRHEVARAIAKGLAWLEKHQETNGCWSTPDHPAVSALVLYAYKGSPEGRAAGTNPAYIARGYEYLLSCAQPDGGIYRTDLPSYNTSVSLMALVAANRAEWLPLVARARKYLIGLQTDYGERGKLDDPLDGGIGYGGSEKRPDLSNTSLALEALYHSKRLLADKNMPESGDLNWAAAIRFIQHCQNLPGQNREAWVSDDPRDRGGFVYLPGRSMAGETNLPSGRVALRSYGSMSYAGLLSYICADLRRDDPRVTAVLEWLRANYTLEENPGMGLQGLYYYYHTMAKALTLCGEEALAGRDGRTLRWREPLALKLIDLQRAEGSWANENGRWWEKDPALVTAYALIALNLIHRQL